MVKPWQFDDSVASIFSKHARQHIPGYDRVLDKCVSLCCNQLDKNAVVIDVGCAVGETLERLHQNGFQCLIGVDNSQSMLDKIRPGLAELYCSDSLPEIEHGYDAALMNWTLHFIPDKRAYIDQIYANLKDGGFVIISDKTHNESPYLPLYHEYKMKQGVSVQEIADKAESLIGRMFINDQQWYRSALMAAGFTDIMVIDADWCFTTFLAWKQDA